MPGIIPNSVLVIPAILMAKAISNFISYRVEDRRFVAAMDPNTRRIWEAMPEYNRLKDHDPIAAERFRQHLVDEIRSDQVVGANVGSGVPDQPIVSQQLQPISPRVRSTNPLGFLALLFDALLLGYMAIRFPAPTIPALIGAGIAQIKTGVLSLRTLEDHLQLFLRMGDSSTLFWGIAGGSLGYAGLAALGIGVPAPDADLGSRIAGGLVFGAAAGLVVALVVSSLPLSYRSFRSSP